MMKPEMILSSDLLDILFEDRNKEYGAYQLRKEYPLRLLIAIGSIPVMVGLFLWISYLNKTMMHMDNIAGIADTSYVVLKQVDVPKPPMHAPPLTVKQKPVATIKNTLPVIVPNNVKADPPPPADDLLKGDRAISNETVEGDPPSSVTSPSVPAAAGTGETNLQASAPEPEKVLCTAEYMPEYPGGVDALRRFLGRNLRVPENVMEPGQRVKVPVRFIVNKNGEISNVEFLIQADEALKQEILRVMRKMPKWSPGFQGGHHVSVYFSIPIIFEVGD